jgi:hypothetical protein
MVTLHQSDSIAAALVEAICTGNLESLRRLLHENPGLAAARIQNHKGVSRTPLHKSCFCCQGVPKVLFHFARTVRRSDG